ncbi:ABC transporter permease [Aeribacillus pallidus]|jgi:ABC-type proline/glycine betaine transport systems, permease component|uniref:ABC transporter permease n=1 Tax=Aeribacillus TaxID=1055323 RepID=UPI000E3A4775|nr:MULTISPECIES: ABC transporter permease [Aeribacillus]REJ21978.1 MAG: glycine/betaine ABC transporter permease [Bacillaceae bacterium]MDR9797089.1 ABC transporter permease [Aeribacillus pallidus]MED0717265.1 ABC transporter permease [Aeribacillus composti]MED0746403.1 ABC transporter permease [Aeribacillus composti]MED1442916.1 ABC transporter permease [Aeribacillus composti]
MVNYITNYYDTILALFLDHLRLTFGALAIALLFALPVGYLLTRWKSLSVLVLSILGIIYVIPSMAFFALLIPFLGLGMKPAIFALVAYSQLILVRNVMVGFQSIDQAIIEAGKGMGLNWFHLFWKIELPLALPIILGGVRIAAVAIIGIGTIAAWINAGGLGVLLFEGLYQNSTHKIIIGTILVSTLALITNYILLRLENRLALKAKGQL